MIDWHAAMLRLLPDASDDERAMIYATFGLDPPALVFAWLRRRALDEAIERGRVDRENAARGT